MKGKYLKRIICSLIIATTILSGLGYTAQAAVEVQSIVLDRTSANLAAGDAITLTASVLPADADNKMVRFASNNPHLTLTAPAFNPATGETSVTVQTVRNCEGKVIAISDDGSKV